MPCSVMDACPPDRDICYRIYILLALQFSSIYKLKVSNSLRIYYTCTIFSTQYNVLIFTGALFNYTCSMEIGFKFSLNITAASCNIAR